MKIDNLILIKRKYSSFLKNNSRIAILILGKPESLIKLLSSSMERKYVNIKYKK